MDPTSLLRTFGSLGAVLGLLSLALWATRRYNIRLPGSTRTQGPRRLAVVERVALDGRRSVALIRRDGREHLILISPEGHHVVETGIDAPVAEPTGDFASVLAATNAVQDRAALSRDASATLHGLIARLAPTLAAARLVAMRGATKSAQYWVRFRTETRPITAAVVATLRARSLRPIAVLAATWRKTTTGPQHFFTQVEPAALARGVAAPPPAARVKAPAKARPARPISPMTKRRAAKPAATRAQVSG